MKKFVVSILAFTVLAIACKAQGIKFNNNLTWEQINTQAKVESKFILVDAFTTWCLPCREMDQKTFNSSEVGSFVNDRFLSVRVQIDRTNNDNPTVRKWYEHARFIERNFNITSFPTILVLSKSGSLIGRILGFQEPKEFVSQLNKILERYEAFDPKYQAYLNGKQDSAYIKLLVAEAREIGLNDMAHTLAQTYINNLQLNEVFESTTLEFIYSNTEKSTDRGFFCV